MLDSIRQIQDPLIILKINLCFTVIVLILSYLVKAQLKFALKGLWYTFNVKKFKEEIANKYNMLSYVFCLILFFILANVALNILFVYILLFLMVM